MAYLNCKCGKNVFINVIRLKQLSSGSVVQEVHGQRCFDCGDEVSILELTKLRQIEEKEKELTRLTEELKNERPEKQPGKEAGPSDRTS